MFWRKQSVNCARDKYIFSHPGIKINLLVLKLIEEFSIHSFLKKNIVLSRKYKIFKIGACMKKTCQSWGAGPF